MANEAKWFTTTQVTLQSSGASLASNAVPTSVGTLETSSHANYLGADFVLYSGFLESMAGGQSVALYARNHNIDSSYDETVPGVSYLAHHCGNFLWPYTSETKQAYYTLLQDVPTSPLGPVEYYIDNATSGTMRTGWTLKCTPKTIGPAT